jgi:DNA replication licensing factor MCM6
MVREAYALLRQSIIHVEQDDINFDEEDEAAAVLNGNGNGHGSRMTQDEESQDAADIAAMEAAESSYNAATSSAQAQANGAGESMDESVPKRKMRITCMSLLS